MLRRLLITTILVVVFLPGLAMAEQIASFIEQIQTNSFIVTDNVTSETVTASVEIEFSFSPDLGIAVPGNEYAILSLTATTTTGLTQADLPFVFDKGYYGSFSIIDNDYVGCPLTCTSTPGPYFGDNLLSATFGTPTTGAGLLTGQVGGNGFGLADTDVANNSQITFSSDFLNFLDFSSSNQISFTTSNENPVLAVDSNTMFLTNTTAVGSGDFSANPVPPLTAEPGTVLLSGAALLGIGLFLRKRKLQPYF